MCRIMMSHCHLSDCWTELCCPLCFIFLVTTALLRVLGSVATGWAVIGVGLGNVVCCSLGSVTTTLESHTGVIQYKLVKDGIEIL